jgi:hypothetical protein
MAKMAQKSAPYYGLMDSGRPNGLRPIMVSFFMVSVPLDLSQISRPYMVS